MDLKQRLIFSAVFSVLFAIMVYYIVRLILPEEALWISIFGGGLAYFLMPFALYIDNKIISKRYNEFENNHQIESFLKTDACLVTGKGNRFCKLVFCDEGIYIVSFDKKPHLKLFIYNRNILKYEIKWTYLYITTSDGQVFCFTVSNIEFIIKTLKDKHWIV